MDPSGKPRKTVSFWFPAVPTLRVLKRSLEEQQNAKAGVVLFLRRGCEAAAG